MATIKTTVRKLSEDERGDIVDTVRDWCSTVSWAAPGYTKRQNIREAFRHIRTDICAGYMLSMALANLDDSRWAMKHMSEIRPGPTALGLNQCQG